MLYRKPATLKRMRGERKTIEIACFPRLQLLRLTDDGLGMIDYRIADRWRQARTRAEAAVEDELRRHQALVLQLASLVDDENTSASVVRDQMRIMLAPFLPAGAHGPSTKVGRVRPELAKAGRGASELLGVASSMSLDLPSTHPLAQALTTLDRVAASEMGRLPEGTANPFGRTWAFLIDQPNREAAFGGYRAATLMLLKRSLRNGQASVDHSLEHRAPEDRLIPKAQWQKERARFVQTYFFRRENIIARGEPRNWKDHLLWHHAAHTVDLFAYQAEPIHPELGVAMDMSIQLQSESGAICTLSLSFNNDGPIGSAFRYICDNGTWSASYDDLITGTGQPVDLSEVNVSRNGIELQDREFIAAIRGNRESKSSMAQVLPCYRVLAALDRQIKG